MVKFGQRLVDELVNDGWEDKYLQYKPLKKIIGKISSHEVSGEMVLAFEKQEEFLTMLKEDVTRSSAFYLKEADPIVKAMQAACEAVADLLHQKSSLRTETTANEESAINVDAEVLEGVEVMDALADAHASAEALRQFGIVNREAVRKILKKYHKKTSAGTEVHADLEGLLKDTPLDEAHETPRTLSAALSSVRDAQAHLALKSRAHAAYILSRSRTQAGSPRPSKDASLHSSHNNSGRLSGRDGIEVTPAYLALSQRPRDDA